MKNFITYVVKEDGWYGLTAVLMFLIALVQFMTQSVGVRAILLYVDAALVLCNILKFIYDFKAREE